MVRWVGLGAGNRMRAAVRVSMGFSLASRVTSSESLVSGMLKMRAAWDTFCKCPKPLRRGLADGASGLG